MIPKVQSMVRRSATECRDHYTVPLPGRFICTKCVVFIVICLWLFLPLCRDSINELAGSLKFPLKKLFVIDGSKRSEHSNAYMWVFLPLFRRLSSHRKHCLDFVWLLWHDNKICTIYDNFSFGTESYYDTSTWVPLILAYLLPEALKWTSCHIIYFWIITESPI